MRCPHALEQLVDGQSPQRSLEATEFLRRWLLHVLPHGFMRVRHYGLLANRTRTAKLARCRALLGVDPPPPSDHPAAADESLVERIRRLTGLDVLRCPFCGQGPMQRIERIAPDTS